MVANNPQVIELINEHYIAVAANDVSYKNHPDQHVWEAKFLRDAFEPHGGIRQGIWLMTPAGEILARADGGWPHYEPQKTIDALKRIADEYNAMPRDQRLLSQQPDPQTDKLTFEQDSFACPQGTLKLRVVRRSLPFDGMDLFDTRHSDMFSLDRLWLAPDEYAALLPDELAVGEQTRVTGPALDRLIHHGHLMIAATDVWRDDDIKHAELTSRVERIEADRVFLKLAGRIELDADNKWNKDAYAGDLLGSAVYNRAADTFEQFELLAKGEHTVGQMKDNHHRGPRTTHVLSLITLNSEHGQDQLIPSNWKHGYPRDWRQSSTD